MKDNLIFWKKKLKKSSPGGNTIVIIVGFLIITLCAVGTGLYIKKVNDEKLAANVERQKTKRTQDSITSFYRMAFSGVDLNQLPGVMLEIERSRLPFSMIGFTETEYYCSNATCRFIYNLNDMFVFSVIDKKFFNTNYKGSFTEKSLDFDNVRIKTGESRILMNMNKGASFNTEKCSNLLNYLYGYNSVMAQPDRVKVSKLPFSSVAAAEQEFPLYRDSFGLMTGEFEVHVPEGLSDVYFFAGTNPYKDLFIVKSIEKTVKTGADVILKGVFICKK
ncbi:hypothetical protein GKP91_04290 [Salmonella enterica subsp. enterica serovar Java]|nr:hypothetical protein [Salmonella enterica subsp. enterica serovar Newport]EAR4482695.1 hypothetical protein [Salmonella enterica]ECE8724257.1 hypothetical protein [Salmonella enterica subsp. enterica serovar Java]EDR9849093.1 hypothetical protein [Salmonella enterica subsp. enterica]EDZ3529587.1 hypothetical protein [Salmonella enterica subsp. arizonae]EHB5299547.1 hypothetical protein [Salmonella enterica subsp. enterica serovar Sandiego]